MATFTLNRFLKRVTQSATQVKSKKSNGRQLRIEPLERRELLTTFYVDGPGGVVEPGVTGSDANNGLSILSPFATIQKAADVAQPGDIVEVRGGTYYESVTLPRSGTAGAPIVFRSLNSESVIVSAGELATSWTSNGDGIYSTSLPLSEVAALNGRQGLTVFVDGQLAREAHHKNVSDFLNRSQYDVANSGNSTTLTDNGLGEFATGSLNGAFVAARTNDFSIDVRRIANFVDNGSTGTITTQTAFDNSGIGGREYMVWDSLALLDSDLEWYYADGDQAGDDASPRLYLRAPGGANPSGFDVDIKRRSDAFDLSGHDHIHLHDFELRGGDIDMDGSDNTLIQNVTFHAISRTLVPAEDSRISIVGLVVNGDNNVIRDSTFTETFSVAIRLNGESNQIVNNNFNTSYNNTGPGAISLGGERHLISHNTFTRFGRSAIGGTAAPESQIQYNDFSHVGLITEDVGAIYLINSSQGNTEVRYNTFHDIDNKFGSGLYLDNQVTDLIAHHNVFYNTGDFGGKINLPTGFALFFNNTYFNNGNIDAFSGSGSDNAYGSKFFNNIFASIDSEFFNTEDRLQLAGNFQSSSSTNFENASVGNVALRSTSGAINAGIVIPGITDDGDLAPDAGALDFGEPMFVTGHNFTTPPNPVYDFERIVFSNLVTNSVFSQGFSGWTPAGPASIHNANTFNLKDFALGRFGNNSVRLEPGASITRTFTGLLPDTDYALGSWVKISKNLEAEQAAFISTTARNGDRGNGELAVGQLANNDYIGFRDIDFDSFDRMQVIMSLASGGDTLELRRGSQTGTLIQTVSIPSDVRFSNPLDFNVTGQSGVDDLFLVFKGSGNIGIVDEVRLIDSAQIEGVVVEVSDFGQPAVSRRLDDIDLPNATPLLRFRTGSQSTTATVAFRMPADATFDGFLDSISLTELTGGVTVDKFPFVESGGQIAFEAEDFHRSYAGNAGSVWQEFADNAASGDLALIAGPNDGLVTGNSLSGALAEYDINFTNTGTYRVFVRTLGTSGADNSVHIGLNGVPVTTGAGSGVGDSSGDWTWVDDVSGGVSDFTVEIDTPGVHTLNLWMREDGVQVDTIVLNQSGTKPTGEGPANQQGPQPATVDLRATEYLYDFGTTNSPRAENYTRVTPAVFGEVSFSTPVSAVDRVTGGDLNRDFVEASQATRFEHALVNGLWEVRLTIGDNNSIRDNIQVSAEGEVQLSGIGSPAGVFNEFAFNVGVVDGSLSLDFEDLGGVNSNWNLNSLELRLIGPPPTIIDTNLTEFDYDFGPAGSPVASGATLVTPDTFGDLGFTGLVTAEDQGPGAGVNDATRDFVSAEGPVDFEHRLSNGVWRVTATLGDSLSAHDRITIDSEGVEVAADISGAAGEFSEVTFDTTVTDGRLNLSFDDLSVAPFTTVFDGNNSRIVIEAENFSESIPNSAGSEWQITGNTGASSQLAVSVPTVGEQESSLNGGPRLDYEIDFASAGSYRVYIRTLGANGSDNSFYVGFNGTQLTPSSGVGDGSGSWVWVGGASITINVPSAGTHTLNLGMREDGTLVDKIVVQRSNIAAPTGLGANATPFTTSTPNWKLNALALRRVAQPDNADFDRDLDVDGADFLAWQRGFGTFNANPADGDANDDNAVTTADLSVWQNQYGSNTLSALNSRSINSTSTSKVTDTETPTEADQQVAVTRNLDSFVAVAALSDSPVDSVSRADNASTSKKELLDEVFTRFLPTSAIAQQNTDQTDLAGTGNEEVGEEPVEVTFTLRDAFFETF